ncbi:hypothetical protein ES332_D11G066400v1 [Gossypium tomentosum]|uniref:Uncharacterized protein n=1 Tax=Gossypium tomentosum TaxID=34277 RepID=A0A5D2IIP4_GOSTO|nr:hypothetical protein ES332_D11G066400v1 [Gossypium tomentosum]
MFGGYHCLLLSSTSSSHWFANNMEAFAWISWGLRLLLASTTTLLSRQSIRTSLKNFHGFLALPSLY